jgi:hypothetical protein
MELEFTVCGNFVSKSGPKPEKLIKIFKDLISGSEHLDYFQYKLYLIYELSLEKCMTLISPSSSSSVF